VTRLVLEKLRHTSVYLRHDRCEVAKTKIEYLGLIISHGQAEMDLVKIAGVAEWPTLDNKKEVQSFLALPISTAASSRDFSDLARLMFDLTRKDSAWQWGKQRDRPSRPFGLACISTPILVCPGRDPTLQS